MADLQGVLFALLALLALSVVPSAGQGRVVEVSNTGFLEKALVTGSDTAVHSVHSVHMSYYCMRCVRDSCMCLGMRRQATTFVRSIHNLW